MTKSRKTQNIAIIGGGVSALAAAITATANPKNKVTVFEQNARVGKKLLQTGNGRCNLSNKNISESHYNDENFFHDFNKNCPPQKVLDFFAAAGIRLSTDSEGRIYPATYSAATVLDALRFKCERQGVAWQLETEIVRISKNGDGFLLAARDGGLFSVDKVIVAMGSSAGGAKVSAPLINSLEKLGHKFIKFSPILVPLTTDTELSALKNQREKAQLSLGGVTTAGEVQFKQDALSGISVFEISFFKNKLMRQGKNEQHITIDFVPEMTEEELDTDIKKRRQEGYKDEHLYIGIVSARVAQFIKRGQSLKNVRFNVTGTYPIETAQVCDGGFDTTQLTSDLQSKLVEGLYFAGECINFAGNCGGYNIHAATATGIIVGEKV